MVRGVGLEPTKAYATGTMFLDDFSKFLKVDLRLKEKTVYDHDRVIKKLLQWIQKDPNQITKKDIRNYLAKISDKSISVYKNNLSALKRFFRDYMGKNDLVDTFKFPKHRIKIVTIPSKAEIKTFYSHLSRPIEKAVFLMYATSGLRRTELLDLKLSEIDFEKRMMMPNKKSNNTKNTWLSFYNLEVERVLKEYLKTRTNWCKSSKLFSISFRTINKMFTRVKRESGVNVSPQVLRNWFCNEMGLLGVPDRYIDAFCGRVPRSILARHYTDYSPERLKRIYNKAGLKVLS